MARPPRLSSSSPQPAGPISNTASVATTSMDSVAANNTATAGTSVVNANQTFVVTNTNEAAQDHCGRRFSTRTQMCRPGLDLFNIPGTGPHTIRPASALPTIADPVLIYGTSQPGYINHPVIVLDGTEAGPLSNGLSITAGNSFVYGLAITDSVRAVRRGPMEEQESWSSKARIQRFLEQLYRPGYERTAAAESIGRHLHRSQPGNFIGGLGGGGNVISGNGRNGITLNGWQTTGTLVFGNRIGTDAAGSLPVPTAVRRSDSRRTSEFHRHLRGQRDLRQRRVRDHDQWSDRAFQQHRRQRHRRRCRRERARSEWGTGHRHQSRCERQFHRRCSATLRPTSLHSIPNLAWRLCRASTTAFAATRSTGTGSSGSTWVLQALPSTTRPMQMMARTRSRTIRCCSRSRRRPRHDQHVAERSDPDRLLRQPGLRRNGQR